MHKSFANDITKTTCIERSPYNFWKMCADNEYFYLDNVENWSECRKCS